MKPALQEHRRRLSDRGLKRVEVSVPAADAELLRRIAKALAQDDQASERLRQTVEKYVSGEPSLKFKDWIAQS